MPAETDAKEGLSCIYTSDSGLSAIYVYSFPKDGGITLANMHREDSYCNDSLNPLNVNGKPPSAVAALSPDQNLEAEICQRDAFLVTLGAQKYRRNIHA